MGRFRNFGLRSAAIVAGCIVMLTGFSTAGRADLIIDPDRYCSAGSDPSTTSDTVGNLSLTDLDLSIGSTTYAASKCYGDFDAGPSNFTNETAALDKIFGAPTGPSHLTYLDGTGDDNNSVGLGGITFVVGTSGGSDGAPGTWTVTWTDTNGSAGSNLPVTVDLAILLMGGNNNAAYLLSGVLLPFSPTNGTGTFDIQFVNNGGNEPSISHLTMAGRIVPTLQEIPEPASFVLFTAGLVGLGFLARRRRA